MPADALPTIRRVKDARPYTWGEAMRAWAPVAQDALTETAGRYHATITREQLAQRVQDESGVETSEPAENWLPRLLVHVAKAAAAGDGMPLVSLCVDDDGYVGRDYAQLPGLTTAEEAEPERVGVEETAARHRLLCYRQFAGDLPLDGGVPGPMPKPRTRSRSKSGAGGRVNRAGLGAGADRSVSANTLNPPGRGAAQPRKSASAKSAVPKRRKPDDVPAAICESCFMQLPASGICDVCG